MFNPIAICWSCVLLLVLVPIQSKADPKFMDDFNPEKFVGKWWLIRVTEHVFNNDEDCAHFVVTKKTDNIYDVIAQFHKSKTDSMRKMHFEVTDRTDHPAIFDLFVNGKKVITVKILGTDYANWAVIYIEEGTYKIYTIASRKTNLEAQYQSAVDELMKTNGVTHTFQEVSGSCVDTI